MSETSPLGVYSRALAQPNLHPPEAWHDCAMPTARLTRRYMNALTSNDESVRWGAATKLINGGGWRRRVALEGIAKRHPSPDVRTAAVWTLGFRGDTRAAGTLANLLASAEEDSRVRSQAAEALGHLLPFHPQQAAVEDAVMKGLDDPSADVRFWSSFAAATIPVRAAAPKLRILATSDKAHVPGWWAVATEAEWALRVLDGDPSADETLPQGTTLVGEHS